MIDQPNPEHASDHVFWLASGDYGRILYVSTSYERIWRHSRQALLENPLDFFRAVHSDDRKMVFDGVERQKLGETTEKSYRIVHPDGSIRLVKSSAFPIVEQNGIVSRIACIARDITERKRPEQGLDENEKSENVILDSVSSYIAVLDAEVSSCP